MTTGAAEATPRGSGAMAGALKAADVAVSWAPLPSPVVMLVSLSVLVLGWGR